MHQLDVELAKAAGTVVVDSAADARKALGHVFGDATHELARMFGDSVRFWRFKNLLRITDEVNRITAVRGVSPEELIALPAGVAFRIAETASLEDRPELQAMWAALIANASTGPDNGYVEKAYISVLGEMSPAEAAFMNFLNKIEYLRRIGGYEGQCCTDSELEKAGDDPWYKVSTTTREIALQNLLRMRCIAVEPPFENYHDIFERIPGVEYSDRQGDLSSVHANRLQYFLENLHGYTSMSLGGESPKSNRYLPELLFQFTALGKGLLGACTYK